LGPETRGSIAQGNSVVALRSTPGCGSEEALTARAFYGMAEAMPLRGSCSFLISVAAEVVEEVGVVAEFVLGDLKLIGDDVDKGGPHVFLRDWDGGW
jgi:hypothetical protein